MDKRLFVCLALLFCVNRMYAQSNQFSLQADVNYYHYLIRDNALGESIHNEPSFGFSLLGSFYTGPLKITSGINVAQKKVYYTSTPTESNQLIKRSYQFSYTNLPVLVSYRISESRASSMYVMAGLIFGGVRTYTYVSEYQNRPTVIEDVNTYGTIAITTRLGLEYSQHISDHFRVNISPFLDIKTIQDDYNSGENYDSDESKRDVYVNKSFGWDRISLGAKVGFEYLF